jgi:hypothetical protein
MDKFKTKQFNRLVFFDEFEDNIPNELISKKEEINSFEQEHKWELAKKLANPYEMVYTQEEKFPYPNISLIKPLSRSYFKMVEMLYIIKFFEELPKDIQMIRSAHIAEGPGGFIQAFIDVSEQFRRKIKKINAITLKSEKHYVPGWKKASNYLKKYSNIINISYGKDGTGDIYIKENQEYFISEITNKVHLFTADGGFDFSIDYCKQEKDIFHLLVSSFYIALKILTINGTCIIKLFDTYSISTQLLLSLCGSCFKEQEDLFVYMYNCQWIKSDKYLKDNHDLKSDNIVFICNKDELNKILFDKTIVNPETTSRDQTSSFLERSNECIWFRPKTVFARHTNFAVEEEKNEKSKNRII